MPPMTVSAARRLLASGKSSCRELLADHAATIACRNPDLNALPTLCLERAEEEAVRFDKILANERRGLSSPGVGPLTGLPYCVKDIFDTQGVRTTYGSPIYSDHIPKKDAEIVRRIRNAGALMVGKSNTPEFAAGSQTFNAVFGVTRNPWDLTKTCGGSSGGGAVALAANMVMLADGSDLAASLRNPASFCGIAGLRPSSHLEPRLQTGANPFNTLSMVGPMARNIDDLRELFLAIFDPNGCAPTQSLSQWVTLRDAQARARTVARTARGKRRLRVGWSPTWGGLPVQHAVSQAMDQCAKTLAAFDVELVEGFPKLPDVRSAFMALRGAFFVAEFGELYTHHRNALKDTVIWNIEQGLGLTASEIVKSEKIRAVTRARIEDFMNQHNLDALAGPTNQVLPFDLDTPYITEINGQKLDTYIDWLASNFIFTVAGLPAVSIPAGFARPGPAEAPLPVGLQLVGRWGEDMALLEIAQELEGVGK